MIKFKALYNHNRINILMKNTILKSLIKIQISIIKTTIRASLVFDFLKIFIQYHFLNFFYSILFFSVVGDKNEIISLELIDFQSKKPNLILFKN